MMTNYQFDDSRNDLRTLPWLHSMPEKAYR